MLLRHLCFSSPRQFEDVGDELVSAEAGWSCRQPRSFYSASSDRLTRWQHGVAAGGGLQQAYSVGTLSDVLDTRWQPDSSNDGATRSRADNTGFCFERMTPAVDSSTPVTPAVTQPYPVSSRHSNIHTSSHLSEPPSSNSSRIH